MATALKPVSHEDRLSIIDHLDELRTRLMICIFVYLFAFGVCFWQNDRILDWLNKPFEEASVGKDPRKSKDPFERAVFQAKTERQIYADMAKQFSGLATDKTISAAGRQQLAQIQTDIEQLRIATPADTTKRPVTLGVGEPFVETFKVAAYAALLLSMPLILYQLYAYVLPAFAPREREVALPLMAMVPFLFIGGVLFCYFIVLPNAVKFLQNFNDDRFDILVQARDYYRFSSMTMGAMGLLFQIPLGIIALVRVDIISVQWLRKNRRYAILVNAVIAMVLPGTDPVTMLLCMAPLVLLYEVSILLAALFDRRARKHAKVAAEQEASLDLAIRDDDDDDEDS